MRRALLVTIPVALIVSFFLRVWQETALLIALTWMYNDLAGGDESFVTRNVIISIAFALYNLGALRVACGANVSVTSNGLCWVALISAVILFSMHIQDLKDQAGDLVKGRLTAPLALGDNMARVTVAIPILLFSVVCPAYLSVGWKGYMVPVTLGSVVVIRTLQMKKPMEDKRSWELWAMWLISLYALPLVKDHNAFAVGP